MRFLLNVGECRYLVSFWGYKKYIPYFISCKARATGMVPVEVRFMLQGHLSGMERT